MYRNGDAIHQLQCSLRMIKRCGTCGLVLPIEFFNHYGVEVICSECEDITQQQRRRGRKKAEVDRLLDFKRWAVQQAHPASV